MSRATTRQISFADWELMQQHVQLDPLLAAISDLLYDQKDIIACIQRDLVRGLKNPGSGRSGLTATQILRSLVLMRVKNWDYRELRERIADGLTLRQFTDFDCAPVPKHDAFQRGVVRLQPQTLVVVNDLLVRLAVKLGLEDGTKLRVDTTVVQTDIHHPTDNTLLWDVVRVVTRLVRRLAKALELRRIEGFCDRTRAAHRRMYEIQRMTTRQRHERQTGTYRKLIDIAEEVIGSARTALKKTGKMCGKDMWANIAIEHLHEQIEHFCGLGDRVVDQTRRRVLNDEQVANSDKIFSIFEPHTDLIIRDKVHVSSSLDRHKQAFGRVPELYSSDRGFFSERNLASCKRDRVKVVCIPQRGGKKTPQREAHERSAVFKEGQRFRAGIEGRISVLFRGRGMKRCLAEGRDRFELLVGAAVLANNLMRIATLLLAQPSRTRRAA